MFKAARVILAFATMFVVLVLVVADPFITASTLTSGRLVVLLAFVGVMLGVDMIANRLPDNYTLTVSSEDND